MNLRTLLKPAVWLVGWWLCSLFVGPLVFNPTPQSTVTKSLIQGWELRIDDFTLVVNDQDYTDRFFLDFNLATDITQHILVDDTYSSVLRGRPQRLARHFETIAQEVELWGGGGIWSGWGFQKVWGSSELEGKAVEFEWDGEVYEKSYSREDQYEDPGLLPGLREDMDLRMLLPMSAVEVGESWEMELSSIPDLISPGGYFAWKSELEGTAGALGQFLDPALMGDLRHVVGELLEGSATVTYVCEDAGVSELAIELSVRANQETNDLTELAKKLFSEEQGWLTIEVELLEMELLIEATGTALWDSNAGRIRELELEGELESRLRLVIVCEGMGHPYRIDIGSQVEGEFVEHLDAQ